MHTVEKIGGTSMTQFGDVLRNIIVGQRRPAELYQRIFVVSAYGGITDLLLEHKKSGEAGVYAYYAEGNDRWQEAIGRVRQRMCELNATFRDLGLDVAEADAFVNERLNGIRDCLLDLQRICSYGHFTIGQHLAAVREMLAAVGEAHSARNAAAILQRQGINAVCVAAMPDKSNVSGCRAPPDSAAFNQIGRAHV
jgi:aspartate kinase